MTHVRKIKSGGVNTTWQNFVGEVGTLFYDHSLGNLRLSDGHTPGGIALTIDSAQAVATTSTVGSVQPDGTTISVDEYGVISVIDPGGTGDIRFVQGIIYHNSNTNITIQPSLFSDGWVFGADGNTTFPNGGKINTYTDGSIELQAGHVGDSSGLVSYNYNNQVQVDDTGVYVMTNILGAPKNFVFGTDGTLKLPTNGIIKATPNTAVGTIITGIGFIQDGTGDGGGGGWYMFDENDSNFMNLYNRGSDIIGWSFYTTGSPETAVTITGRDPIGQYSLAFDGVITSWYTNFTAHSPDYSPANTDPVVIETNSNRWNFRADGKTQFPNYTFPSDHGTAGQVLIDNGSGILSWVTPITTVSNLISGTYTIGISASGDLLPTANNLGNLGSPTQQWNALYVNTATVYIGGNALRVSAEAGITLNNQGIGVNTISAGTDTTVIGSAGTFTVYSISTLQSVTGRGATTNNRISITNTTTSAGYQTGALTVSGGVGVAGALNVNGAATFGSTAVFQGPVTFAASSNTSYTANLFMLHTPPDGATATWTINDGKDIGILYPYYTGTTGTTGALVLSNGSKNLEWFGSGYNTSTQVGSYGTFKTNAIILAGGTQSTDNTTGDLIISGGAGIGKNLRAAYIYSNGWIVTTTTFNTSTLVAIAVTSTYAQSFNTATLVSIAVTSTYAKSFNTSTLVALAVTSTYAQSFNTSTLVNTAVNATTATYAQSFNTGTLINTAVNATTSSYATTATYAQSFNTATLVAIAVTSTYAQSFNTATLIANAVTAAGLGSGVITISNTGSSTSSTSGALRVSGGVGVAGSVYAGAVYSNGYAVSTSTASAITIQLNGTTLGVPTTINFATGTTASIVGNVVTVQATAVSGSATTSTLNAGTYTVSLSTSGVLTVPGTLQNLLNTGSVTISASSGTNTATWTFGTAGSLAFPDGSQQLTAFTGTFNTATLVSRAVSASTSTIAQSVVGGIGVATLTAGTGTFISTSTGGVTIWISTASTFNTGTLVAIAVTSTYAQSFNTSTLVNSAVYANTASGNFTVPGNLNVNGGSIYNNGYALTTATSFNTATLVAQAVTATSVVWPNKLSIGQGAGYSGSTFANWIAIGTNAGGNATGNGESGISIGYNSNASGSGSISLGSYSLAQTGQGNNAIAIGTDAGNKNQGNYSIAIGYGSGKNDITGTAQAANTIIINASGSTVDGVPSQTNSTYITPIRNATTTSGILYYNTITYEVTYGSFGTLSIGSGLSGTSYNGSASVTMNIDYNIVATTSSGQAFTNKTINASLNTISSLTNSNLSGSAGITNANLANSSVTVGTTTISLGGSNTAVAGLTQIDVNNVRITGNIISTTNTNGNLNISTTGTGTIVVTNTTNATSTNTGALQVRGGVGVGGSLYTGGMLIGNSSTFIIGVTPDVSQGKAIVIAAGDAPGSVTDAGSVTIRGGQGASSSQAGSVSLIAGDVSVGGAGEINITAGNNTIGSGGNINLQPGTGSANAGQVIINRTTAATSTITGALRVYGGVGIGGNAFVGGSFTATGVIYQGSWAVSTASNVLASPYSGIFTSTNTTSSISTNTGALQVVGGVGIGGQVFIGGNSSIAGITTVTNTTAATSTSTGALQVYGGVGVGGNLYVGGIVTATIHVGSASTCTTATTAAALGYMGTPINTQASTYTLVIGDAGKTIYAGGNLTIPSNTSVAFPVGTIVNVIASAGITIAITTDTLQWGGQATSQTGTRTVATYGMATLVKVTNTIWYISGVGVT